MNKQYSASTSRFEMIEIMAVPPKESTWAVIRIAESAGFISIQSDHGDWAHQWTPSMLGDLGLFGFLASLSADYACGKFLGARSKVFDGEKSIAAIRDHILDCRSADGREGADAKFRLRSPRRCWVGDSDEWNDWSTDSWGTQEGDSLWTRMRARREWDLAEAITSEFEFGDWYRETTIDDAHEIGYQTVMDWSWRHFWDRLWVPYIVPNLRELAEGGS